MQLSRDPQPLGMGILVQHSVGALVQALSPEPGRHTIVLGSGDPSQKRDPILVRGFIPRARARGHARTLRARALYGTAQRPQHVDTLLRGLWDRPVGWAGYSGLATGLYRAVQACARAIYGCTGSGGLYTGSAGSGGLYTGSGLYRPVLGLYRPI